MKRCKAQLHPATAYLESSRDWSQRFVGSHIYQLVMYIYIYIYIMYIMCIYTVTDRIMEKTTFQFTGAACL